MAIAAAATNDTVGKVMSYLNVRERCKFVTGKDYSICKHVCLVLILLLLQRAIEEERYMDAAFVRDYANAGLVSFLDWYLLFRYVGHLAAEQTH